MPRKRRFSFIPDQFYPVFIRKSFSAWFRQTFRALRSRNYKLFFGGQSISLIGTWMQQIALSWLVYRLTNSVFLLGLVGFSTQIPALLVTPLAGILIDRYNSRHILITTQILSMIQALLLWLLIFTNQIDIWHILVLSFFLGTVNAVDAPTRQSFVVEMIEKRDDLVNAIALNSAMFNSARLIGPAIGGVVIALVGEGNCFLLNGISYLAVIGALMAMRLPGLPKKTGRSHPLTELMEGFRYTFGQLPFRTILFLIALINFVGVSYSVMLPALARDILHGGAHTLGFLMGMTGAGALTGALFLASRKDTLSLLKYMPLAISIFLTNLVVLALSRSILLDAGALFFGGLGMMLTMGSGNTLIQSMSDDRMRGRVMSFYAMSFLGIGPFGSLLAGTVSQKTGLPFTFLAGAALTLVGLLLFLIYLRKIHFQVIRNLRKKQTKD